MKIERFNKLNEITLPPQRKYNLKPEERVFPLKCRYKNRTPDPGMLYIISIDFEDGSVSASNGRIRYRAEFKELEFIPDIFVFDKYNL